MNDTNEILSVDERSKGSTTVFGFWLYLMTDLVLFASLFAVFAVLRGPAFGGASMGNMFSLPYVLVETIVLLSSSFACGIALLCARAGSIRGALAWLSATFVLGAIFVGMEVSEFSSLIAQGDGPSKNGFLSSYFTLVGTHGTHVAIGLLWLLILIVAMLQRGLTHGNMRKLALFAMFWHFLEIVWIFIFTIVYLTGSL
ncbi:MAG TPA: cytochrome o ubiquinol oxidase subunit III [Candidatus Paceibacterota bacterium]|jgi:cytochrome o ubiquinol oxidase subunit 3|nr:cytochrome o ubiquinol oxidase subunit III [Candidatus Paceibacterota bacterium]